MLKNSTVFISSSGLFDFDLTLFIQAILFLTLSFAISFVFLNPISKSLQERNFLINYIHYQSIIITEISYNRIIDSIFLLTQENLFLNKNLKFLNKEINSKISKEINNIKEENDQKLKEIKSKYIYETGLILSFLAPQINKISEIFFKKQLVNNFEKKNSDIC